MNVQKNTEESSKTSQNLLYKLGGIAALVAALGFRRWFSSELVMFKTIGLINTEVPSTTSALDWFNFIQKDRLIELIALDFFDIINYILVGLILLGLYFVLQETDKSATFLALVIGFVGIAVYLSSNQALAILSLSDQYVIATESEKPILLAAGQSLLTMNKFYPGGSSILIGFYFVNMASLIMAVVMLKNKYFTKIDAYIGILANGFNVSSFLFLIVDPELMVIPIPLGSIFLLIWYIKVGLKLYRHSYSEE
jgi:hypothetical protein